MLRLGLYSIRRIYRVLYICNTCHCTCRKVLALHNAGIQFKYTSIGDGCTFARIEERIPLKIVYHSHYSLRPFAASLQNLAPNSKCRVQRRIILCSPYGILLNRCHIACTTVHHYNIVPLVAEIIPRKESTVKIYNIIPLLLQFVCRLRTSSAAFAVNCNLASGRECLYSIIYKK